MITSINNSNMTKTSRQTKICTKFIGHRLFFGYNKETYLWVKVFIKFNIHSYFQ